MSSGVKMGLVVLLLAVSGMLMYRHYAGVKESNDFAQEGNQDYFCHNPSCKQTFKVSTDMMKDAIRNSEGRIKCPHCGSMMTGGGLTCVQCKQPYELIGHGAPPEKCPHCGYAILGDKSGG